MVQAEVAESGARARTRRAIIDAAVGLLSRNPRASLAEVAAEAGVGRTTVHRYFPERSDLLTALSDEAYRRIAEATEQAGLSDGAADEVLIRLCQEYLELGDWLTLVFTQVTRTDGGDYLDEVGEPADAAFSELVVRGHRDGSIDDLMSPEWLENLLWSLLFTTWTQVRAGAATRHEATTLCLATLRKIIIAG